LALFAKRQLSISELFRLAEPYLKVRDDFLHTRIAHEYAVYLLEREAGDKKIVEPAVILHDVGWSQLKPEEIKVAFGVHAKGEKAKKLNRIHEVEGARIAREILTKLNFDCSSTDKIARIIERHDLDTIMRWSGRIQPMKSDTTF
jgi:HD superfamily phosphodiesterase